MWLVNIFSLNTEDNDEVYSVLYFNEDSAELNIIFTQYILFLRLIDSRCLSDSQATVFIIHR